MTTDLPSRTANFRTVLFTGRYSQVVLMTIPPEGEIGEEVRSRVLYPLFPLPCPPRASWR